MKNKFVGVIVNRELDSWVGPNPDTDPTAIQQAKDRSQELSLDGKEAYPVIVEEIRPKGRPRSDERPRRVVSAYLPEDVLKALMERKKGSSATSLSAEISNIVEEFIRREDDENKPEK